MIKSEIRQSPVVLDGGWDWLRREFRSEIIGHQVGSWLLDWHSGDKSGALKARFTALFYTPLHKPLIAGVLKDRLEGGQVSETPWPSPQVTVRNPRPRAGKRMAYSPELRPWRGGGALLTPYPVLKAAVPV